MYTCILISNIWELGVAYKRAAGAFFLEKTTFLDFLTMSILETVRIVRISISMDLGTCLKRRAPKIMNFGGTQTSRSLTTTWLVTETMDGPELFFRCICSPGGVHVFQKSDTGLACVRLDDVSDHSKSVRTSVFAWPVWHGSSGTAPLIHAVGGMSWPWHELRG